MLKEPEAPRRPDENDTRPVSGRGDDRLLLWCLVASLFINFGFGLWMNLADVYGEQHLKQDLKRAPIHIYHPPPIKKKPKPKPKPKIIPPKPIKIVHVQPKPHPTPPPPRPVVQHFTVGTHSTSKQAVAVEAPVQFTPPQQTQPVSPPDTTPAVVPPTQPTPPPPTQPVEKYVAPPPPPPPPPPHHDKNFLPNVQQRDPDLSGSPDVDTSGLDMSTINGPCVVSLTVDVDGHVKNVRVKKSSGNDDFDQAVVRAVSRMRGVPAVQDNEKYEQQFTYTANPTGG